MNTQVGSIKLFDLDNQTVLQITKFVRMARLRENASIELNNETAVEQVLQVGDSTRNAELQVLHRAICASLQQHIKGESDDS